MSGGGGGPIIIQSIANSSGVSPEDKATLLEISDRSVIGCTRMDAIRVLRIVWKLIRK